MKNILIDSQEYELGKIICVGRNYVEHIKELNNDIADNMVIFLKPASSITETLVSFRDEAIHYEAELCITYKAGKVFAIGVGLDLTKRNLQSQLKTKGLPWERAKAFDGSALFSDFIQVNSISEGLNFRLIIDKKTTQVGNIDLMIYKPETIYNNINAFMSVDDGDIIMTGTPKGVGVVKKGQNFEVQLFDGEKLLLQKSWFAT